MSIRKKIADWLDRGYRQAYEDVGIPTDHNGFPFKRHTYLFALKWHDTGNVTNVIKSARDAFDAHNDLLTDYDWDPQFGIINIIQLD